jgi:DNA-binding NtrC family response regulator
MSPPRRRIRASAARQPPRRRSPTVLIVEDEAALRELVEATVRAIGYQTIAVATVAEAETVRAQHGLASLALVIADVHLTADRGVREGYALWERWHTAHPRLPFLLLSGDPAATELWGVRTEAVRLLSKPFALDDLQRVVRELVGV